MCPNWRAWSAEYLIQLCGHESFADLSFPDDKAFDMAIRAKSGKIIIVERKSKGLRKGSVAVAKDRTPAFEAPRSRTTTGEIMAGPSQQEIRARLFGKQP